MTLPLCIDIITIIAMTSNNKNRGLAPHTDGRWSAASDTEEEHGGTRRRSLLRRSRRIMGEEFTFPGMFVKQNQTILQNLQRFAFWTKSDCVLNCVMLIIYEMKLKIESELNCRTQGDSGCFKRNGRLIYDLVHSG
jgi:hypothetical protein